jgi:hypothetical protein
VRLRVRLAAVSALIAIGGVLPACGDDSDPNRVEGSDPKQIGGLGPSQVGGSEPKRSDGVSSELPYTGQQVFDLFYMHGLYLQLGERWDRIVLNSVATPQQREAVLARYGYFFVSIAHDTGAIQTLLSDPNTGQPLQPDGHGVYWYRDPGMPGIPAAWFALKRYGNVIAAWMAGGEQRTDEHWDRMNSELERLPPP